MALGMEVGLCSDNIVLEGDPAPRPKKGGTAPNFRLMSNVANWLYASGYHLLWR